MGSIGYTLGKWFGVIDYDQLAEAALDALAEEMEAWKREDNPFHQELLSQWDLLIARFLQEPATLEALQEFGRGLFDSFPSSIPSLWKNGSTRGFLIFSTIGVCQLWQKN